jgi:NADPH:quinone reductase-like Zn-dependent oxidoreductase
MSTAQALLFNEVGDPQEVLSIDQIEVAPPGPGRVTVAMEASPIDPTDLRTFAASTRCARSCQGLARASPELVASPLSAGDWIAQTAANSAVGRSVITLAQQRGLRTVDIVRRPEATALVNNRADAVLVVADDLEANLAAALGGE